MTTAHEEIYRGCTIRLVYDEHPTSPREWGNVGTMACFHDRYALGDKQHERGSGDEVIAGLAHDSGDERFRKWADLHEQAGRRYCWEGPVFSRIERHYNEHLKRVLDEHYVILPLYLYEHSGITMSTGRFSCQWDSGRVGFIYCTLVDAAFWMVGTDEQAYVKWDTIVQGKPFRQLVEDALRSEVETYDAYLTGQVVGYIVEDPDGNEIHSLWGFYPDEKGHWPDAIEDAKLHIDHWHKKQDTETAERTYWEEREVITKG